MQLRFIKQIYVSMLNEICARNILTAYSGRFLYCLLIRSLIHSSVLIRTQYSHYIIRLIIINVWRSTENTDRRAMFALRQVMPSSQINQIHSPRDVKCFIVRRFLLEHKLVFTHYIGIDFIFVRVLVRFIIELCRLTCSK